MDSRHLLSEVVIPTLQYLRMDSGFARQLLLGTVAQESRMGRWLVQLGGGPALGIYQMEPDTHDDIWLNYLTYRPSLVKKLEALLIPGMPKLEQLKGNLFYATAMARIHYRRVTEPFPKVSTANALGQYWKDHYNTEYGHGSVAQFEKNYKRHVARFME